MMKRLFKKTLPMAMAAIISLSTLTFGSYIPLYERISDLSTYADGVTHRNIQTFTDQGWINLNVIRVDLTKNLQLVPLTDTYLSTKDTLTKLVEKNSGSHDLVTAINADFFGAATIGQIVNEGKILTTSVGGDEFATFNIAQNGQAFIDYLASPVNRFSNGTSEFVIDHVNKPHLSEDRLIVYDHNWGPKSFGNTVGYPVHEVLVVDGIISEIRRNGLPFDLDENSFVIAAVGERILDIEYRLKIGDSIEFLYDDLLASLDFSVGGGAQIVDQGKVVEKFSQNITGWHPRTALGITENRESLILVTVDGRSASFRGVSQTELAQILIDLGAYEAINFDGGGSSQMIGKSPWTGKFSTLNYPSDMGERRIFTGIGVEKYRTPTPDLQYISIQMDQTSIMKNSPVSVDIKAIDTNYDLNEIDKDLVQWSVEGIDGHFVDKTFVATSVGKGEIKATYGDKKAYKVIEVSDQAVKLTVSPSYMELMENESAQFSFSVITKSGDAVPVSTALVDASITGEIGSYDASTGTFISSLGTNKGMIEFKYDGLATYVPVGIGVSEVVLYDFETPTGTFSSYPVDVPGRYFEVIGLGLDQSRGGVLSYDFETTDVTRAVYMDIVDPKPLPKGTKSLGVWVQGDSGNGHWLRGRVTDANGLSANLTFARNVDWNGYQYVTATLPDNLTNPVVLDRIYLAESDPLRKFKGEIFIDNITATVSRASLMEVPKPIERMGTVLLSPMPSALKNNPAAWIQYPVQEADDLPLIPYKFDKGIHQFNINNAGGGIRKNDSLQWQTLLTLLDKQPKSPMVLVFSHAYYFTDRMEEALFFELIGKAVDRGTDVAVVFPTQKKVIEYDYVNGVKVLKVPEQTQMILGQLDNTLHYEVID